jgi:hypothetical protein
MQRLLSSRKEVLLSPPSMLAKRLQCKACAQGLTCNMIKAQHRSAPGSFLDIALRQHKWSYKVIPSQVPYICGPLAAACSLPEVSNEPILIRQLTLHLTGGAVTLALGMPIVHQLILDAPELPVFLRLLLCWLITLSASWQAEIYVSGRCILIDAALCSTRTTASSGS